MPSSDSREALLGKYEAYDRLGFFEIVKTDFRRWETASEAFLRLGFYTVIFYRISHYSMLKGFFRCAGFFQLISHLLTGAEISNKAIIGPHFAILHPTGVHIGPKVRIGSRATLCECSSIVVNLDQGEDEAPIIGDNFWAGAGCRVMGPLVLGDRVWGGPNSVVLKDVKSDMVAFGIPATIFPKSFRKGGD